MTNLPSTNPTQPCVRATCPPPARATGGRRHVRLPGTTLGLAAAALVAGCGGRGEKPILFVDQATGQISTSNGKFDGATPYNGDQYIVDPHGGGQDQQLRMSQMYWGRLVDIFDETNTLVYGDFVIGEDVRSEPSKWTLETNPVTGKTRLVILETNTIAVDANGVQVKDAFDLLVEEAEAGTTQIDFRDVDEVGVLTRIARNCAIVVQFTDLIDESTIVLNDTIKILTGNPPSVPFDARILPDPNHGGREPSTGEFQTTRILIDTTVTPIEQAALDVPVALNNLGLPGSTSEILANVAIYFPTEISASNGQFRRLTNLRGRPITTTGSEPIADSPTLDVVRAMRTGTADEPNNGFLVDVDPPRVLGSQDVFVPIPGITRPADADEPTEANYGFDFEINYSFLTIACAVNSEVGHAIQVSNSLIVDVVEAVNQAAGSLTGVRVRVPRELGPVEPEDLGGSALYLYTWQDAYAGLGLAPCFLRFAPTPATAPATDVPNDAQVALRFSEAMDPASFGAFDSFRVTRNATPTTFYQYVVGEIGFAPDLREFRFLPVAPFSNQSPPTGTIDTNPLDYFLTIVSNSTNGGLRDLAGNLLASVPPPVTFTVSNTTVVRNSGYVFRFSGANLDENGDGNPDSRGSFSQIIEDGRIVPRPVTRFARTIDANQPIVAIMPVPAVIGVQTPLSNLGSRLHQIWRYSDMGLDISRTNGSFNDLDAEFAYLAPVGGQIVAAFYPEYSLGMAHSRRHPDEINDVLTGFPEFANSGFQSGSTYADTYLAVTGAQPFPMHPRTEGFVVASSELATSELGTPLLRLPLNKGLDPGERTTFTWRNTSITTRGQLGPGGTTVGPGVPTRTEVQALGFPGCWGAVWGLGGDQGIPTVGLPLLLEHRTYPTETLALINFQISISNGSSRDPSHRAFSTGGYNPQGSAVVKNPDLEISPSGGFNGLTGPGLPQLGAPTPGLDNTVYFGQVDFVVRLSRGFTIPVDASGAPDPVYIRVVLEPTAAQQPLGTAVQLAFRAHDTLIPGANRILNAANIDVYGEEAPPNGLTTCVGQPPNQTPQSNNFAGFSFNAPTWRDLITQVNGNRYVQYRITFVNNVESGFSPSLSSLGVAYTY
jgi:hypothetical protein